MKTKMKTGKQNSQKKNKKKPSFRIKGIGKSDKRTERISWIHVL